MERGSRPRRLLRRRLEGRGLREGRDAELLQRLLRRVRGAAAERRPLRGACLRGGERWILALQDVPPEVLARLPRVRERIAAVRAYREASKSAPTRKRAATPTLYHVIVLPDSPFLVIPEVSSELREYASIGWLEPPTIPSNKLRLLANATLADFALLTSAMHMAWMRAVTGRMKSDYMYSVGVVYNTFPMPPKGTNLSRLEPLAQAALDARADHPGATLADLYDPDLMPPNLRGAHRALDRAVDRLYRRTGSTGAPASRPNASASSTCSCSMRRCMPLWRLGRGKRQGAASNTSCQLKTIDCNRVQPSYARLHRT